MLGSDHLELATTMTQLAQLKVKQGKYEQGNLFYKHALVIHQNILGDNSSRVGKTLDKLAELEVLQHNVPTAKAYFQRALKVLESSLGPKHPYYLGIQKRYDEFIQQHPEAPTTELSLSGNPVYPLLDPNPQQPEPQPQTLISISTPTHEIEVVNVGQQQLQSANILQPKSSLFSKALNVFVILQFSVTILYLIRS
jgi:hypothetical protein